MLRLVDLLSDIASEHGYYYNSSADTDIDSDTTNKPRQKYLKRLINNAYLEILGFIEQDFLRTERVIKIPAPYETGTVTISQGGNQIVGVGTTFTMYMQMRQILISGEEQVYFLKEYETGTAFRLSRHYQHSAAAGEDFKIATWAIPLPADFLAPLERYSVMDADSNRDITLLTRQQFRSHWLQTYSVGSPSYCCIDGVTDIPRRGNGDTAEVEQDSATVTPSAYAPDGSEQGGILKIEGDSTPYRITDTSALTLTVSPVVQRTDKADAEYEIDPPPLPLLWFNYAASSELHVLLRYVKRPDFIWTDEQRIELSGDFENAMVAYAKYLACQFLSRDTMQKQEALGRWQLALSKLPQRTDLGIITKETNRDARRLSYRAELSSLYNQATE